MTISCVTLLYYVRRCHMRNIITFQEPCSSERQCGNHPQARSRSVKSQTPVSGTALVAEAEAHCARNGLNFTRSGRLVLEVLAGQSGALGAYTIVERLAGEGVRAKPTIVYRALDFLIACGFAHRIESVSGFVACRHPHRPHYAGFPVLRRMRERHGSGLCHSPRPCSARTHPWAAFAPPTSLPKQKGDAPIAQVPRPLHEAHRYRRSRRQAGRDTPHSKRSIFGWTPARSSRLSAPTDRGKRRFCALSSARLP